jgi:nitrite reductase (cytochrome c-552)
VGFHNPTEATRICGDSVAFAEKSSGLLRQALAQAGVTTPVNVELDLAKYLQNRGVRKLSFKPQEEFKDPYGIQNLLTPTSSLGLPAAK